MKTTLYLCLVIILTGFCACNKTPKPGNWKGESISFEVNTEGTKIIRLNVVIPQGDEFLAQEYQDIDIKDNKFESFQDAIPFVGVPKRDLKGEFVSNTSAKGTFNDIPWEAKPE